MVDIYTPPKQEVEITESAERQILVVTSSLEPYLRLAIRGGGCSGFEYSYALHGNDKVNEDDHKFKIGEDAYLIIDAMSMMYLVGSTFDYKNELMGSMFDIKNPQVTSACGCGQSIHF